MYLECILYTVNAWNDYKQSWPKNINDIIENSPKKRRRTRDNNDGKEDNDEEDDDDNEEEDKDDSDNDDSDDETEDDDDQDSENERQNKGGGGEDDDDQDEIEFLDKHGNPKKSVQFSTDTKKEGYVYIIYIVCMNFSR